MTVKEFKQCAHFGDKPMTTKELYQQMLETINALEGIGVNTAFYRRALSQLCEQLCKEQREICADPESEHNKVMIEDVAGDIFIRESDILNAPMPEL